MSDKDNGQEHGLFSDPSTFHPEVTSIPLTGADSPEARKNAGIGDLVKDATTQVSTLIRSEVELAKTEISGSAKKGGIAVGLFGGAGVILAYSSFFFFFFLAELLDNWMPRWVAFLVVFLIMFVLVAILAIVGIKFIKGVKKPAATIQSVSDLKEVVPKSSATSDAESDGLYT